MAQSEQTTSKIDSAVVEQYLNQLQTRICKALEQEESGEKFIVDNWQREAERLGGGGSTRVLTGKLFEKAGVNVSVVKGDSLPAAATVSRPELMGCSYRAMGLSLVIHPHNPFVPTAHANVRLFTAEKEGQATHWWFGGGYDLTPYYGFEEDCVHWHQTAANACMPFGEGTYEQYKKQCDEYFYIKHRDEPRGVGGLFFDDVNQPNFATCFELMQSVGDSFLSAYMPIVARRKDTAYTEAQREFQAVRRGRYVEFNLVHDRGTLFGLQSTGRTESILMSLPPKVQWHYQYSPAPGSIEGRLYADFLAPRDWLKKEPVE